MSGIGPVEPSDSTSPHHPSATRTPAPTPDTMGTDRPRLTDRWSSVTGRRRALLKLAGALVAAGVILTLLRTSPAPDPHGEPPPVADTGPPWPAALTSIQYEGVAAPAQHSARTAFFTFLVTVSGRYDSAVTVSRIDQAFPGLDTRSDPVGPFTVKPGTTRRVTLQATVHDCATLPGPVDLPYLDTTLRNARAVQEHSFLFTGPYARDLSGFLAGIC
ncbi:hypothetical protein [Streptomyces sp. NPDC050738]|uniref:hypothetical protein n=1 Tax=Streptomyces sp. NPDC050738 TaxID=3154744 RepID=UPI0034203712